MNDDFTRLYALLGVREDCSLEEFKRACRRRIRKLHPDRGQADPVAAAQMPLADLLPLYTQALQFHRVHGRLPGATLSSQAPAAARVRKQGDDVARTTQHPANRRPVSGVPARSLQSVWLPSLLLLGAVAVLAVVGSHDEPHGEQMEEPGTAVAQPAQPEDWSLPHARLELGMDEKTVRAIQGEPLQWNGSEWIYGPSWLRFEDGSLVDWYSSPLHPLHTSTRTPPR